MLDLKILIVYNEEKKGMITMFIFRRVFSIFISMFLFITIGTTPGEKYEPIDKDNLKLSAVLLSDIHMEGNNTDRWNMIGTLLRNVYQTNTKPDVVAFAGDNTMNGQDVEWFDFYGFVNRFITKSKIVVAFGNHDFGNTDDQDTYNKLSKRSISAYNGYANGHTNKVYYSTEVNGYKFIVLGSEQNAKDTVSMISDTQIEWLKGQLKEAEAKGLPAFVINHNMLDGKNGPSSSYYKNIVNNTKGIDEALKSVNTKVLYVSGHAHMPLYGDSKYTEENVTYINIPCATANGSIWNKPSANDYGVGCVVEVYENTMHLRFRCFGNSTWVEGYDDIVIDL